MVNVEQMKSILDALPDPAFILSRTGKYVAVFGGRDKRYYHDGSGLVGLYLSDLIKPEKANWFLEQIDRALASRKLLVEPPREFRRLSDLSHAARADSSSCR